MASGLEKPRETMNPLRVSISIPSERTLRDPRVSSSAAPPSDVTYGMVAADLLHALLAGSGAPCVLKVQSLFVLDENSYPLQQDFSLLDFYLSSLKHASQSFSETRGRKCRRFKEEH